MIELLLAITFDGTMCRDVADDGTQVEWACSEVVQAPPPPTPVPPPTNTQWQVYNDTAQLSVTWTNGAYYAELLADNAWQETLWFNGSEGRADFVTVSGDFTVTARNVGIEFNISTSQWSTELCGLIAWQSPGNWEFATVGKRSQVNNTIEYKVTQNAKSKQKDIGSLLSTGKADLRVSRSGNTVTWEWSQPGAESWSPLNMGGLWNGRVPFGSSIRVGLITYGYYGKRFACSADAVEIQ